MKIQLNLIEKKWVVGPFQCNCRLLACPKTGDAVLVDPGDEAPRLVEEIKKLKTAAGEPIRLKYLLHTHAHLDHIGATRGVRNGFQSDGIKIALHRADLPLYEQLQAQGQRFGFRYEAPLPVDHFLSHEEELQIGLMKFSVIHNPGHSPGSVSFRLHEDSTLSAAEKVLTGDTLFQGSVGRTDLWGADGEQMFKNIRERLLTLDPDTCICPGHGADSTIGIEKKTNPFL